MELKKTVAETLEKLLTTKSKDVVSVALNKETPALIRLRLDVGLSETSAMISDLLTRTLSQFNIARNMTDEQIAVCSLDIIETFPQLNLFDIQACFKKAEAGTYGKIYHGIDKTIVFEWLYLFEQEKLDLIVQHREKENKNLNVKQPFAEEIGQNLSKIDFKIPTYEPKTYDVKSNPFNSITIQNYMKEFDKLHKEQDNHTSGNGMRYVDVDGTMLLQEEYIMYRLNQDKTKQNGTPH